MSERPGVLERTGKARRVRRAGWMAALLAAVVAAGLWLPVAQAGRPASPAGAARDATRPMAQANWPTYLATDERTSASDARIGPVVSPAWTHVLSGFIASEPIIVNQRVYVTAWDGYLYALDQSDGHELWRTFLGTYQIRPSCEGQKGFNLGITAAPAYDPGTQLLYVSAMSATVAMTDSQSYLSDTGPYLYALETVSGTIQWQQMLSADVNNYAWSSPLIANGRAYVGVASEGDCPLTQGQLVAVGLTGAHSVQRAVMGPDSLAVNPPNLVETGILSDESNYNYTATAIIDFHGPQSAGMSIRLRHLTDNQSYQPLLYSRNSGQGCGPGLIFVQNLDDPKQAGPSGELDFTRDITVDTAVLNDGMHFLAVPGLFDCAPFEAGIGGGIWSSPTYDAVLHRVYVTTGTPTPPCVPQISCTYLQSTLGPRSAAVVALDADTLGVAWSWQVPFQDQKLDADFGATPALCAADNGKRMLGVANKNGVFYAFDTQAPGDPLWQQPLADGGPGPETGQGSISSAACAGGVFYVGAGKPQQNAACQGYTGQVWALYAAGGAPRWNDPHCTSLVMGPVTAAGGMVMYGANCRALPCERRIEMLDQATGALRYRGTPDQLAALGDMVSGIAVVDGLMVSGDSLPRPGYFYTQTAYAFPPTGTVRALRAWAGTYLPLVEK